jgi:hypothetical protein
MLTRIREGSSPFAMMSNQTSPVNISAGPFVLGCMVRISNFLSSLCSAAGRQLRPRQPLKTCFATAIADIALGQPA